MKVIFKGKLLGPILPSSAPAPAKFSWAVLSLDQYNLSKRLMIAKIDPFEIHN